MLYPATQNTDNLFVIHDLTFSYIIHIILHIIQVINVFENSVQCVLHLISIQEITGCVVSAVSAENITVWVSHDSLIYL